MRFFDGFAKPVHEDDMVPQSAGVNAPIGEDTTTEPATSTTIDARVVALYDQYFDFVWRSLRRLGVAAGDLDDAAQDVFIVVHRRLPTFEERSAIKSWIFAIALRIAKDYRRRAIRQRQRNAENEDALVCLRGSPEEAHARVQAAERVLVLLDGLDDDKRAVFVLSELERMPAPEIAIALGIPMNTVYSRLRLARVAFEDGLKRFQAKDDWRSR